MISVWPISCYSNIMSGMNSVYTNFIMCFMYILWAAEKLQITRWELVRNTKQKLFIFHKNIGKWFAINKRSNKVFGKYGMFNVRCIEASLDLQPYAIKKFLPLIIHQNVCMVQFSFLGWVWWFVMHRLLRPFI